MSAGSGAAPSCASRRSAAAWSRSAPSVAADTGHAMALHVPRSGAASPAESSAAGAGACSRIRWALVPLRPKEETPARRGRPSGVSQVCVPVSSSTAPAFQSTCVEGASTCRVFGSTPCLMACTILITPATPAAACVWPMFDLTEPSHNGRSSVRSSPYVASSACASIGSPSLVPVPCASTASTSAAASPASASAALMTRCCEGPLGAVMPLDAPSWLTAEPRITPSTWCPLLRASSSRSSRSMAAPSPQPVPSADAENALHRPSEARPRWRLNSTKVSGVDITVTPPARASEHSPERRARIAECMATREEEQAVSMVMAGPSRPSV